MVSGDLDRPPGGGKNFTSDDGILFLEKFRVGCYKTGFRVQVLEPLNMTKVGRTSTHNTGARRNVASIEASVRVSQIGHYVLLVKTWDSSAINAYPCSDCDMGSEWSPIIYRKGEHSLRDRDHARTASLDSLKEVLYSHTNPAAEIVWIPLRDGAGHCFCSAEG